MLWCQLSIHHRPSSSELMGDSWTWDFIVVGGLLNRAKSSRLYVIYCILHVLLLLWSHFDNYWQSCVDLKIDGGLSRPNAKMAHQAVALAKWLWPLAIWSRKWSRLPNLRSVIPYLLKPCPPNHCRPCPCLFKQIWSSPPNPYHFRSCCSPSLCKAATASGSWAVKPSHARGYRAHPDPKRSELPVQQDCDEARILIETWSFSWSKTKDRCWWHRRFRRGCVVALDGTKSNHPATGKMSIQSLSAQFRQDACLGRLPALRDQYVGPP